MYSLPNVTHVRHHWDMSTQTQTTNIPQLTLGWRLQMALGDQSVQALADELGVTRQTIGRWMHDKGARPRRAYILQWALITGVDSHWLETGEEPQDNGPNTGLDAPSSPTIRYEHSGNGRLRHLVAA